MKKFDTAERDRRTHFAKERIDNFTTRALLLILDGDKERRRDAIECRACFYLDAGKLSGQGFTDWSCEGCGKKDTHHNTSVPKLCAKCAKKFNACVRCGAAWWVRP